MDDGAFVASRSLKRTPCSMSRHISKTFRPGGDAIVAVLHEHGLQESAEAFGELGTVGARITGLHRVVAMRPHHVVVFESREEDASRREMVERRRKGVDVGAAVELDVAVDLLG